MKQDSYDLEQCLLDWKNKAADLRARLEQSSYDEAMPEDYQRQPESQQASIEGLERYIKQMHTQAIERQEESTIIVYSGKLSSKWSTVEVLDNQPCGLGRRHIQKLVQDEPVPAQVRFI